MFNAVILAIRLQRKGFVEIFCLYNLFFRYGEETKLRENMIKKMTILVSSRTLKNLMMEGQLNNKNQSTSGSIYTGYLP